MDENTLKRVLDEALEPIKKKQDEHSKKLDSLWDQTTTLTEDVAEIKETLTPWLRNVFPLKTIFETSNL